MRHFRRNRSSRQPLSGIRRRPGFGRRTADRFAVLLAATATIATGLTGGTAQAVPANDLEYTYFYDLTGPNPPTTPQAVLRMAVDNFDAYFPFQGCPNIIGPGAICPLQGPSLPGYGGLQPIRVEAVNATSFTFRALPGHAEGADRMIQFTFGTQRYTTNLNLEVHAWGPWSPGAAFSIASGFANGIWGQYAQSLADGIATGDYNNYSGPFVTVDSNPFTSPRMAVNADGRLETFVMDSSGNIQHDWQNNPGGVGGWSGWANLGGGEYGGPVVGRNPDGRLEVFAIGSDYTLQHNYQKSPGGSFGGWSGLGNDGHNLLYLSVGNDADGLLQVLALDDNGELLVARQASNGAFNWTNLGGDFESPPVVASNANGRLEVFALDSNYQMEHAYETSANGSWSGFSLLGSWHFRSDPVVGVNSDGRLEVFAVGTDGALDHIWQLHPSGSGGWSSWAGLGSIIVSAPAVTRNGAGNIEVFALGPGGDVVHIGQSGSGAWGNWSSLGGAQASVPTVGDDPGNRMELNAIGLSGSAFDIWQTSVGGGWSGWTGM
jgi:hypothetical protein